jgi:cytoskeleton protein RodZ
MSVFGRQERETRNGERKKGASKNRPAGAYFKSMVAKGLENPQKEGMSTVAEQLRQAREAQKLTIQELAEITKIRSDHIRALEEGNFNIFSAPVYIRGFVRTCSTLLKMDVPQVMSNLEGELGQTVKFREPPPLTDAPRTPVDFVMLQLSKVNWRAGVVIVGGLAAVIIIVLVIAVGRHAKRTDPLTGLKPGVYQPNNSGETLPVPAPHH